jgi:uncharacterized protein YbjT (DUF2867 family)
MAELPEQIMSTVVVFGRGGFLGRRLVDRLTAEGMTVRVAVRRPDQARFELRSIGFDRVTVIPADVRDRASVAAAVAGADAVVNAVSTYVEQRGVTFEAVHVRGAENVAREATAAGVARLVLVSGIGADPNSSSPYMSSWFGRCFRELRSSVRALCSVRAMLCSARLPTSPDCCRYCR